MQIVASPVFGVRVSGGHLCKAEAPTEVETETVSCTKNSLPCVRGAGVRLTRVLVSCGHLCEAEAPTEAAAETVAAVWLTEGLLHILD